ncbi:unnamed protein product, partial [Prorocentrum cordatum]
SLPRSVVGHGGNGFCPNMDFKRVPSWAKASQSVECLSNVVELSNGFNAKHVHVRKLQIIKSKDRGLPTEWRSKFSAMFDNFVVDARPSSPAQAAVEDVANVALEDDSDSGDAVLLGDYDAGRDVLFMSNGPKLNGLLSGFEARMRAASKRPDPEFHAVLKPEPSKTPTSTSTRGTATRATLEGMEAPGAGAEDNGLSPSAREEFNAPLKGEARGKAKEKKQAKPKKAISVKAIAKCKGPKPMGDSVRARIRRERSKACHGERGKLEAAGAPASAAMRARHADGAPAL